MLRDHPLANHRNARPASKAAECAGEQGKLWEMHDLMLANYRQLERPKLTEYAQQIGLETTAFDTCVDSDRHDAGIEKDLAAARQAGITATPTFLLGHVDPKSGEFRPIRLLRGAQGFDAFKTAIDAALSDL